jgi:hypothetical protein
MTKFKRILIATTLILAAPFVFACDYPAPPKSLPDGASSTKDEMLAGVKLISAYQENMATYLACVEADEVFAIQALADDDEDGKKQRSMMFEKKYNAAVEEQTRAVEEFNAQIRAYKSRAN